MNNKYYLVILRNTKDGFIKSVNVVPSLESYLGEVRAFVHNNPSNALALFAEDWEIVSQAIDIYSPNFLDGADIIPISSWKVTVKEGE